MKKILYKVFRTFLILFIPINLMAQENAPMTASLDSNLDTILGQGLVNLPFETIKSSEVPGSVTFINPDEFIIYDNISSVNDALSSRVPGIITGTNLYGLGNALVIIDGIPGSLSSITLEEVDQITVLKDINSAILYGVQAGRGVILVTTKRGQPGKPTSSFVVDQGFSKPISYPNYLNSADYMELYNEARENDGLSPLYSLTQIEGAREGSKAYLYPDTDYYSSEFLNNTRPFSRYQLSFSGGNTGTQYFMNAGLLRSGSFLALGEKEQSNQLNIRSNVNFKINDFLKANIDIAGIYNINNSPNGNFWNDASTLLPTLYPPLIDTAMVLNKDALSGASLIDGKYVLGGTSVYRNNVYGNLYLSGYQRNIESTVQFSNGLDVNLGSLLKGLSFNTRISFLYNTSYRESQNNEYAVYSSSWFTGDGDADVASITKIGLDRSTGTQGISNTGKFSQIGFYGNLNYHRLFGQKHAFTAMLLGYGNTARQTGSLYENKNAHAGSKLNYVYDGRYIFDFSSAIVSSVKLPPGNNVKFSPSLGIGWLLSEENFLKGINGIDYLKIRASAGIANTDLNISDYYLYETAFLTSGSISWNDGGRTNNSVVLSNVGNSIMGFEKRVEMNIGVEAAILNNALWFQVNFFHERNTDQLIQQNSSTPMFLGGIIPWTNYGEEMYQGIEFGSRYHKTINNFSINLGLNLTYLTSELVKTDEVREFDYQYRAGKRTDAIFGLEAIGLFKDNEDIAGHHVQTFGTVFPGDIKYADQNNDGIIDLSDAVMIGNSLPNLSAGLNLHLKFKNLSLFALANGHTGSERYSNNEYYWVYGERKYSDQVLNRWTAETADEARYPRLSSVTNSNNFRNSTWWLYDNSRINLSRLQLTYDFNSLTPALKAENIAIYIRATNLAMLAANREKIQLNIGSEPQTVSYSIGLRAIF